MSVTRTSADDSAANPLISIVIPFRDKIQLINDCLRTMDDVLEPEERRGVELVIVNNRSTQEQLQQLVVPASLKHVRLDADIDFNFQTLINLGAARARGEFLLLLNNDILFTDESRGFLRKMIARAREPDVGAVGPLLWYPDHTIQHAGVVVGMHEYAEHLYRTWTPEQANAFPFTSFRADRYVSAVTAAFLLVETKKFRAVNGMDERFIICGGDVDLCLRLHLAGFRNLYMGSVAAIHLESKSRSPHIPENDFVQSRRSYDAYLDKFNHRDPFYPAPLSLKPTPSIAAPAAAARSTSLKQRVKAPLRRCRDWLRGVRGRMRHEPLELIVAGKLVKIRRRFFGTRLVRNLVEPQDVERYRMLWMRPLAAHPEFPAAPKTRLNVVIPHYNDHGVFAGLVTAVSISAKLALKYDVELRFICVDDVGNAAALRRDLKNTLGPAAETLQFTVLECHDRTHASVNMHERDHFLATAWWTCYQIRSMIGDKRFFYLIQDFECGFYPWGHKYANSLATYGMNFIPIFNTTLLRDFFAGTGLIPPAAMAAGAAFQPAVNRALFSQPRRRKAPGEKRRLFFYGREEIERNLFPTGVVALADAIDQGVLDPKEWEFVSAGQPHAPINLARGAALVSVGKMSLTDYAKFLSTVDVGLSLMLSPHPSYPPLEVTAAGALCITNNYENKDLSKLSPNIITCAPTTEGIVGALRTACARLATEVFDRPGRLDLPNTWDEAFDPAVDKIHALMTP
jgi:GT2 family glycosyltransferase